ncbi:hypothetical protein NPIL_80141 [Nephila pilipes]|uniref:Uncharacterized protein n=1 Tax=Nephila pilipes TaxID=299642 RepID=A0A8X6UB33_NEPPI|nr:hypothetical protein NPIL_80141 [Nephila pilipes]
MLFRYGRWHCSYAGFSSILTQTLNSINDTAVVKSRRNCCIRGALPIIDSFNTDHYSREVRNHLDTTFHQQGIGRGGPMQEFFDHSTYHALTTSSLLIYNL